MKSSYMKQKTENKLALVTIYLPTIIPSVNGLNSLTKKKT